MLNYNYYCWSQSAGQGVQEQGVEEGPIVQHVQSSMDEFSIDARAQT